MTKGRVLAFPWANLSADNFDAFWQLYPRRVCKLAAERAWARITPTERIEALRAIRAHVDQWLREGREYVHIPHAATWINGKRWLDELEEAASLGRCEWNRNGNREPGAERCAEQAEHTNETGHVYCKAHALTLGLVRRKARA
jgi:hypothetical protein